MAESERRVDHELRDVYLLQAEDIAKRDRSCYLGVLANRSVGPPGARVITGCIALAGTGQGGQFG